MATLRRSMPGRGLYLLVALVVASAACETSINPATGRREVLLMSPEQERELDAPEHRQQG